MARILLIDDDEKLGELLKAYFKRFDMQLDSATRPSEGLARLQRDKPDLVILDGMLPEMDGFDVCRTIRKTSSVPVIMLTARGDVTDRIVGPSYGRSPANDEGPRTDGQARVFVVEKGRARAVRVVLGVRDGRYAEVLRGLAEGAQVVTDGKDRLRDGRPVRVAKTRRRKAGMARKEKADPPKGKSKKQRGTL